jgi:cystathionine beta-lyase/cystathionine gamma-synthase
MATPIVQTSLFAFPDFTALLDGSASEHEHARVQPRPEPHGRSAGAKLARLERGESCKCFASGMAAISAVMLGLLRAGDHILFVNHTYGPTMQLAAI